MTGLTIEAPKAVRRCLSGTAATVEKLTDGKGSGIASKGCGPTTSHVTRRSVRAGSSTPGRKNGNRVSFQKRFEELRAFAVTTLH